ncbi:cutinase family protein [Mycolicibacterium psychrotolerans]|uniref:Cutinase n=1 Tax=Mycolicibacterium psychrotolerans TaxID=216929 RepID=A0A7I7MJ30_9MYCO|nr:cutinase family protein [Mycolicibacterium psychrotolerans]BBX71820.1 cutinase [Mycolicibacterium psychrotolerans]
MKIDLDIRRGPALVATLLASTAFVFAPAVAAPVAHAQGCPDIEVVFARGTDEPAGLGRVGSAFVDSLSGRVGGRSVGSYAVDYPATYDFLKVAAGANDASNRIQYMIANCPNTRLVLGGYSQGAAVIDVIAAVPVPGAGFTAPLPPNAPDHVAAIAVFGNPSAKIGLPLTSSPVWGPRSIDLCTPGDPVCSGGDDIPAHSNYAQSGLADQAAGFVAGLL